LDHRSLLDRAECAIAVSEDLVRILSRTRVVSDAAAASLAATIEKVRQERAQLRARSERLAARSEEVIRQAAILADETRSAPPLHTIGPRAAVIRPTRRDWLEASARAVARSHQLLDMPVLQAFQAPEHVGR
jgi:cell division protein FtsB